MERQDFEIEGCSNSVLSSVEAEKGGANRVELCDNLYEGGTTPSIGTIIQCKEQTNIDVFPIIRPRGGDFCYSENEISSMVKDIEISRDYGADGFAIGWPNVDENNITEIAKTTKAKAFQSESSSLPLHIRIEQSTQKYRNS